MFDLIGRTLGSYRILEQIGAGGMATVYKAYQPSMDRYVAIKILPPSLSKDEQFTKRFQREARAIAKLEHAHILPVHDYGEHQGISYIVMRYVEAGTLKEHMGREPLSLDEVNRLIGQMGSALDYAHRFGVIHRDIKPGNVLVDEQKNTYLTDFGLARMMESSQQLTASGVGVGTPAYMSPEQGQGIKADQRSDIYSLGVILYEMVVGRVPYEAETPLAVVLKHITAPLPLPHEVNPDVPEAVERVILKALAKDPADRFQTAGEMAQALSVAIHSSMTETQSPAIKVASPVVPPVAPPPRAVPSMRPLWETIGGKVLVVSGAVVVLAVIGLFLSRLSGGAVILAPGGATTPAVSPAITQATSTPTITQSTPAPTTLHLSEGTSGKILFEDSFDTGLSTKWSHVDSGWRTEAVEGRTVLHGSGSDDGNFASYLDDWSNYALQTEFKFLTQARQGVHHIQLFTRWSDCGENVSWLASYAVDVFSDRLELVKGLCDKPGEWLPLAQVKHEVDPAQWHSLQFTVAGNRIEVYVDGDQAFNFVDEDSPLTSGGFALVTNDGGEALFDNVRAIEIIPRPTCGVVETELFFDDFQDGNTAGWNFSDEGGVETAAWPVEQQNDNYVLVGDGHNWAVNGLANWHDYALHVRLKLLDSEGSAHLNVMLGPSRYFLNFPGGELSKDPAQTLSYKQFRYDNEWHTLVLSAVAGNLQVYRDGELFFEAVDPSPLDFGRIGLENLVGRIWYDDVLVCQLPS